MKKLGPGRRKFIDGGLFGALNRAVAWTGAGAMVEKKTPRPGQVTGAERGIEVGARRFRGPGGPITNTWNISHMMKTPNHPWVRYHQCGDFDRLDSILLQPKRQPDSNLKEPCEEQNEPQLHRITGDIGRIKDK